MKVLFIIISVLILLIILLSIPAYISVEFLKNPESEKLTVQIRYLFFKINPQKKKKKQNPSESNAAESGKNNKNSKKKKGISFRDLKELYAFYKHTEDDIADILYYFSKKAVTLNDFKLYVRFGTNDAMRTGIATGAAYVASYNLISLLNNIFTVEHCDVSIVPVFEKPLLEIDTKCIIKVKNVHITVIAFKVLKMYLKILTLKKRKGR